MSEAIAAPLPTSAKRALHVSLWVVQALLAAAFMMAGTTKVRQPMDVLATMMPWTTATGLVLTRFIGSMEILASIGLILPSLTRIQPKLTALAAVGLTTVMVLASGFHVIRGELSVVPFNLVFGGMAAFVAWGRFKLAPIAAR